MKFEEFYNKYFGRVYNYARYRSASAEEADEITALIFEKLLKKYDLFDEAKGSKEAWLFSVARNVVNDYYRRKKIRAFFSLTSD